jgi:aspartate/methionine/tyrosine aminotransferase
VIPSKFAIYATILATTSPGDEVLIPNPTYLFEEPVRLAGAKPVFVPLRPDYGLDPAALEAAVTPRTRVVIFATPGNPTGTLLDRRDLQATIEIARDHDLIVASDETYESLVYEGTHVASAALAYGAERVVTLGSFSKTFAMTGWRAGYAVAPPPIRARMVKVVEHTLTCIPPFVQEACRWALENAEPDAERFRGEFRARRDALVPALESIPGFHVDRPHGAFYTFPAFDLPLSSREFCERLLAEEHVAVVPGVSFGPAGEHHVRISYTHPTAELLEGAERIRQFVERHRSGAGCARPL